MKCRYLHVSADIMSVTVSICMYLQVPCQYLHVCVDIRWFLIPQLRFWSPFWSGRDHYSVQKILSKRKRNSVLQNGNEVDMAMPCFCPFGRCELPYPFFLCIHESFILISSVDGIFRMKLNFCGMQWLQIPCTPVNVGSRLLRETSTTWSSYSSFVFK